MKVCDRCKSVVHDLETYRKPDATRFDLCVTCELDHQEWKIKLREEFDRQFNVAYELQLADFMAKRPDRSDPGDEEEQAVADANVEDPGNGDE